MNRKSSFRKWPDFLVGVYGLVAIMVGCQTNTPHYISQRTPTPVVEAIRNPSEPKPEKPLDLFVRQKDVKIRRKAPVNETGSLTDLNDPRAYLFGFERPIEVGMFLDVKISSNRADQKGESSAASSEPAAAAPTDSKDAKGVDAESLLKSLPNLEPGEKNKPVLLKSVKMEILERFDNGDVLVMYRRRSIREGQGAAVDVTARLPAEALARVDNITTQDLADVDWRESLNGDAVERKSANWEDEYSLRLSGFDETKSKDALGLDEKREQLKNVRDKLENEMKGFSGERQKFSKERSDLLEEKAKDSSKITELEKQNTELQKKVEDLSPKAEAKLTDDTAKAGEGKSGDSQKSQPASKDAKAGDKGETKSGGKVADKSPNKSTDKPVAKADAPKKAEAKKDEAKTAPDTKKG